MNREIESFQDSIRRTFIWFSLTPVIAIVFGAIIVFIITWSAYMASSNRQDNEYIASEMDKVLADYYAMIADVEMAFEGNTEESRRDRIFSLLYEHTAKYDEIGSLFIVSPEGKIFFSSSSIIPQCLTGQKYYNWGVWNRIKRNPGLTSTILYEGVLYVVHGVYREGRMEYAIVYAAPSGPIADIVNSRNRYCVVADANGWVYLSNTQKLMDTFGQIRDEFEDSSDYLELDGQKYIFSTSGIKKGMKVFTFYDIDRSFRMILILVFIIAVIFIGIIFITYRSTATSSEIYTKDIKKIENAFEAVQEGDLDVTLHIDSNREFLNIGNDFNKMLGGLKEQISQNAELAENVAFSQVKQLESQFNPHFLFNTLDNIRFMAKIDPDAADKMIVSLSGLLRYSIRDAREEVTVMEDLDHLQYYLNILKIRFNKRFEYNINVSDDIYECLIPKLLLQPVIENSIKYGFGDKEKLTVKITGYQLQERLIFICEDDGVGIDEDELNSIRERLAGKDSQIHIGLYNIHRRIQLLYKGDYGLDINSEKGEGTVVRLTLPKRT